ncbi:unnamed protein product [Chrysoparadoxa australica]
MTTSLKVGFIGTGKIATALTEGFCLHKDPALLIALSPRNQGRAQALQERFKDRVTVCESNQEVADRSDYLFICLLPEVSPTIHDAALPLLNLKPTHGIISAMASVAMSDLLGQLSINPSDSDHRVCRCVPLPSSASREGPILVYPPATRCQPVLDILGTCIVCQTEAELKPLICLTGMLSPFHHLQATLDDFAQSKGVDSKTSGKFVASLFSATAALAESELDIKSNTFSDMAHHAATPGGLNEMAVNSMIADGVYESTRQALQDTLDRLEA